ncbi:hypothetical protein CsatB_000029 [Cannabis sativa]
MEDPSSSSSSFFSKSKQRVFQSTQISLLFLFFFFTNFKPIDSATLLTPTPFPNFESVYDQHCSHIVPRNPSLTHRFDPSISSSSPSPFRLGYFRGGAPFLNQNPDSDYYGSTGYKSQSINFYPFNSVKTLTGDVYQFQANLNLRDTSVNSTRRRGLRLVRFRGPKSAIRRRLRFSLSGYWSESSRKLCMVGSGSAAFSGNLNSLSVVLKLDYPINANNIYNSLIIGSLESLDGSFEQISLMGFYQEQDLSYEYTLVGKEKNGCEEEIGESLSLENQDKCFVLNAIDPRFKFYCNGDDCDVLGKSLGFVPTHMFYHKTRCSTNETKWQMLLSFSNSTVDSPRFSFTPKSSFIAEGEWNAKDNRFCGFGCRVMNFTESFANAYVGDCTVGFNLRFPASFSLRNRSSVVGEIWNTTSIAKKIEFRSFDEDLLGVLGYQYKYSNEIDSETFGRTCGKKNMVKGRKGKAYPVEYSSDMRFDMSIRNRKGQVGWGYSTPFYVENQLYRPNQFYRVPTNSQQVMQTPKSSQSSLMNISYRMSLTFPTDFKLGGEGFSSNMEISAEGTYDRDTGVLCMRGCRNLASKTQNAVTNHTSDCEFTVFVQFSPLKANSGKNIKGSIESRRKKSDPFYFESLELSSNSLYSGQAAASIWRMDLEITLVLISNTLTCVLVGLQLFHIKSHPNVVPFISIVMLVLLTMGNMIPLLLNFEAMFVAKRSQQNVFLGSGGWLEVNEVIVRIVTMIAFLLQLRLLQLTWSSRQETESKKTLWNTETKVLYITLPIYIGGAFIAWLINHFKNSYGISSQHRHKFYVVSPIHRDRHVHSLWEDLKSYAGLALDGFLLPQILFNVFSNSGEMALSPLFYTGTTLVRLMPHAYDLYRAHAYASYLDLSYIYASHKMDLYSTAWNIVIPFGGLLLALVIFLQQKFGGRCILPKRFRHNNSSSVYEKVPVVIGNDDL